MNIFVHEKTKTFHLQNDEISYIMTVLPNGHMGQLYFGKKLHDREDFSYLLEGFARNEESGEYCAEEQGGSHAGYPLDCVCGASMERLRLEYPSCWGGDFRQYALEILQDNGSRLTDFAFSGYELLPGKPRLAGLPATYTEEDGEAQTLVLKLRDETAELELTLLYTIFAKDGIIAISANIKNTGKRTVYLERALSLCLDLPDMDYEMVQFSGTWTRERHPKVRRLEQGLQGIESIRGSSSHHQNPFLLLRRPDATEMSGEVMGFSLVYSGNFMAQVQVDTYDASRVLLGIHPDGFSWKLSEGENFQTPEAVIVWSDKGQNGMSQAFHRLYQRRLCRGYWRDKARPILLNNWEATYFDFNEEKLLKIARKAKENGVELFVLDDGWFGKRRDDYAGLGDWVPAKELLPEGIAGLSRKIEEMGMMFGLWFEPEMVNPDSDLYRAHPDWVLSVPERKETLYRHQLVLDFSRKDVVDYIFDSMAKIFRESRISYVKWDYNRYFSECFSRALPADQQGEVFHRYILGLYDLYERLTSEFPHILFESCASGGGRFDPGLLYYAPQTWTSDNTDCVGRLQIQYGTSFVYPVSSMGSHVSAVPNHQVRRVASIATRANVAAFGTYGYELDLNKLTGEEQEEMGRYTEFMKKHRELLQFGTFYRLKSPFEGNETAWMVVSEDKKEAIVGYYKVLSEPNQGFDRLKLAGLREDVLYEVSGKGTHYGDELMNLGIITSGDMAFRTGDGYSGRGDFDSVLYFLKAE